MAGRAQDGGLPHRGKKNLLMLAKFWFWTLRTNRLLQSERGSDGVSLHAGGQSETRWCESKTRRYLLCGLDVNEVKVDL